MQVIQNVRTGETAVKTIPAPICLPGHVLVAVEASVVSAGTERYVVDLARKSLLGKALDRPDHVRRVLQKIKEEGLFTTLNQVRGKLDEPMPLGYSAAGIVLECGRGVQEFKPRDRVAVVSPHSEVASVGRNLCACIPDGVSLEDAAYAAIASIGLEGVRLTKVSLGESVLVIGLGLIGQICVCLLKASGCRVFGIDVDPRKLELARTLGADVVASGSPLKAVIDFSGSFGVDAVLITAATDSNGPIEVAAEACRPKGRIVLVGVAGLNLPRPPFFKKELEFTVSSSLGPGRGDPAYEEKGYDYPIGFARWTAQRNMQAVLNLMADGKLPVGKITTHRFPIERASEAYELITSRREPFFGIVLKYPAAAEKPSHRLELCSASPLAGKLGVSVIGAGNFARLIMMPMLNKIEGISWRGLCTAKGVNAEHSGRNLGFQFATTEVNDILSDSDTSVVFIATRHDLHAELVTACLRSGKHVFVEKPLCIKPEELQAIAASLAELGPRCPVLTVGFNRRFAPTTARIRQFFDGALPLSVNYRFSPGHIPADHWTQDEEIGGGRIVGEACHAIDTCVAITGSVPVKAYAESVVKVGGVETADDRVIILLRHQNGSISSVSYQAGGDRAFPSERIEVFGGGKTAVSEAWDRIQLWNGNRCTVARGNKDKGHMAEFSAFVQVCKNGGPWPIPWDHLYAVTQASLAAVRSLREGIPIEWEANS